MKAIVTITGIQNSSGSFTLIASPEIEFEPPKKLPTLAELNARMRSDAKKHAKAFAQNTRRVVGKPSL